MAAMGAFLVVMVTVAAFLDWKVSLAAQIQLFLFGLLNINLGCAFILMPAHIARRRRITGIALAVSCGVILFGWICTRIPLPGARIEMIIGVFTLCFFAGPLSFRNKFEKWKTYTRSGRDAFFLSLFDYLGISSLLLGVLFKIQHWPWANNMTMTGLALLALGTLAWNQKFKKEVIRRKETEDKLKESLEKLEAQKRIVEEKQKEVLDSIYYARRIQRSLLPGEKFIQRSLDRLPKRS